jgi:hypothetical protein
MMARQDMPSVKSPESVCVPDEGRQQPPPLARESLEESGGSRGFRNTELLFHLGCETVKKSEDAATAVPPPLFLGHGRFAVRHPS